jgi:predicted permease
MAAFRAFPTQQALPWLNKFVFYVAIPCTVFRGLATQDFIRDKTWDWQFIGAFLLLRVFVGLISFAYTYSWHLFVEKRERGLSNLEDNTTEVSPSPYTEDWMGAFLTDWISLTYLNTLIFGIPVIGSIYGPTALLLNVLASLSALFFQLPVLLLFFEWRKARMSAQEETAKPIIEQGGETAPKPLTAGVAFEKNLDWKQKTLYLLKLGAIGIIHNPPMWGIVLGLIYSLAITSTTCCAVTVDATGKHITPMQLDIMLQWLGDTVTPLASFCIGLFAYQHWREMGKLDTLLRNILLLIGKFLLVPMLMIGIIYMLGMTAVPGTAWKGRVSVLIAQMPVALAGFTLCAQYGSGREVMALQVAVGTLIMIGSTIAWDAFMESVQLFGPDTKRLQY